MPDIYFKKPAVWSPAQVGCMRQALGSGALRRPRGIGWRGRWEGGWGWGTHVNSWLFHFNVWKNPLKYKKLKKKRIIKQNKQKKILLCFCFNYSKFSLKYFISYCLMCWWFKIKIDYIYNFKKFVFFMED